VRERLRSLVKFVEKTGRTNIYTDFVEVIGEEQVVELQDSPRGTTLRDFETKHISS